jgi:hypothetical protein
MGRFVQALKSEIVLSNRGQIHLSLKTERRLLEMDIGSLIVTLTIIP